MRKIFYLFAIISATLFVYSAIRLSQQSSHSVLPTLGEIKGFEDNKSNDEYSQLVEAFRQKIKTFNDKAAADQTLYFWMNFIVTALTAASTLVSSIKAAKKEPENDPNRSVKFAITIALLAFCSTLVNFAASHFNDLKTEETKKAVDLTTMRNQFYADYDKASPESKSSVIKGYEQRLD